MKRYILPLLLAVCLLSGCGDPGPWEMPQVDAAPTPEPTPAPVFSSSSPETYIWNTITSFNMSDPGVSGDRYEKELSHNESLALFGADFLPGSIFSESRSPYKPLTLKKTSHQVILDGEGQLQENAYVEYVYLPSNGNEKAGLTVMAELCSHETVSKIYSHQLIPHAVFAEGTSPKVSSYYLNTFMLMKQGDTRYAQALVLPGSYFSTVSGLKVALEDGEDLELPRQVLLSFTCGEEMSDEEFIAAVCRIWSYGPGNDPVPPTETPSLPQRGEKGAA